LAIRLVARILGDAQLHPLISEILAAKRYAPRVRAVSAAIARVEMEQRPRWSRVVEYLYVLMRMPRHERVTVGPAQIRVSRLKHPVTYCHCKPGTGSLSSSHYLAKKHYSLAVLQETATLIARHGELTRAVNAYNKGTASKDLMLPTVYSEVVLAIASAYLETT